MKITYGAMGLNNCGPAGVIRGMVRAVALWTTVLLGLVAAGCEPRCREIEPMSKVEAQLMERLDERLDDIDASAEQRKRVRELARGTLPEIKALRRTTLPRQREIMAELKQPAPDRKKLTELIDKNVEEGNAYMHRMLDVLLEGHGLLTQKQRDQLADRFAKPSERFEGSFMLDRGVDYFLSRIDADESQRALVERIKVDLIARGGELQQKVDRLRALGARELAKPKPDAKRLHGWLDEGKVLTRQALFDLTGYYLLLASKLDARQRQRLNVELVRIEPCGPAPNKPRAAPKEVHKGAPKGGAQAGPQAFSPLHTRTPPNS